MDVLVERAQSGDRRALEELLAAIAPRVHRFGLRMCKNEHDADDVLQETLLNVALHLEQFEGRSSLSSWAFALARSACTRRRRGLKNRPALGEEHLPETDQGVTPESEISDQELADALSRALSQLPEEYREVIWLRDVEDLTTPEAASSIGVSPEAVKSRLHRARAALREALRPLLEAEAQASKPGCPDLAALWSRKLEGDLSQQDCASMEKHLASCQSCASACSALKRALVACRRVASTEVPGSVQLQVKAAVMAWAEQLTLRGEPKPSR